MERPILFSTDMVKAILEGRKTQTRRIIKPQPPQIKDRLEVLFKGFEVGRAYFESENDMWHIRSPYQPGDILWVKEKTFGTVRGIDNQDLCYATHCPCGYSDEEHAKVKGWRPSIHMPREAARIILKVANVRVERLQDISEEDAEAEGCINNIAFIHSYDNEYSNLHTAKEAFKQLWNTLNAKHGYSWDVNPWVWVIEFEKQ